MTGRTMYVVPYLMGAAGFAAEPGRRGNHRQRLRGGEHAHHGAHGQGGAGPHRQAATILSPACIRLAT